MAFCEFLNLKFKVTCTWLLWLDGPLYLSLRKLSCLNVHLGQMILALKYLLWGLRLFRLLVIMFHCMSLGSMFWNEIWLFSSQKAQIAPVTSILVAIYTRVGLCSSTWGSNMNTSPFISVLLSRVLVCAKMQVSVPEFKFWFEKVSLSIKAMAMIFKADIIA